MSAKYRPAFLSVPVLLFALTLPGLAFGQQTADQVILSGQIKVKTGDWDGAIADFTKAIELNPKSDFAYVSRGVIKRHKRDLDGAIADFSKAIQLNPKNSTAYAQRGHAKVAKGDLDGGIADYSKTIELSPKIPVAYLSRGEAKRAKGDRAGAVEDFFNGEMAKGDMDGISGDLEGAIVDYTRAIKLHPKDADAYFKRGVAKTKKGDQAGADEDFAQAARLKGGG
jgi:tetratricopeptide (TPR) repeat protein